MANCNGSYARRKNYFTATPFAARARDRVLHDVNDLNSNIRMQNVHIGVFPLKGYSIIYVFYHRRKILYLDRQEVRHCYEYKK